MQQVQRGFVLGAADDDDGQWIGEVAADCHGVTGGKKTVGCIVGGKEAENGLSALAIGVVAGESGQADEQMCHDGVLCQWCQALLQVANGVGLGALVKESAAVRVEVITVDELGQSHRAVQVGALTRVLEGVEQCTGHVDLIGQDAGQMRLPLDPIV